jgi:integrase
LIALAGSARRDASRSPDSVMLIVALNHYYDNDIQFKPSAKIAFRAIQLIADFVGEKVGVAAPVSAFSQGRQREFMRWSVARFAHSAGTISRNLSVVSAALHFSRKQQIVRDGFGNETEVTLLDNAPDVVTQAREVARLTSISDSVPRDWLPSFGEFGAFIDKIDIRQENLFRFVMMALNTWSRPEAIIDLRTDRQVDWAFGVVDLNPPGRRQTKKFRPKIKLTENLGDWLHHWDSPAPMIWDGKPVSTMKKTFKRHALACGHPNFTQDTIRHFMATYVRQATPRVSKEQRDIWLGHNDQRTASWYEHRDPEFLDDARCATESVIEQLQSHTRRSLSARKLRANSSLTLVKAREGKL